MRQTGADRLRADGRKEGRKEGEKRGEIRARREDLLRLLRNRFGELPLPTEQQVNAARDLAQLTEWFDRASTAPTLADVGIL
jgi:predicted transposase YdaD